MNHPKLLASLFFILFCWSGLQAQNKIIMDFSVSKKRKKLSNIAINIYHADTLFAVLYTNKSGKAEIVMDKDGDYSIDFGGNEGWVQKRLLLSIPISFRTANNEDLHFPAEIDLFEREKYDMSRVEEPIKLGRIVFKPNGEFYHEPEK